MTGSDNSNATPSPHQRSAKDLVLRLYELINEGAYDKLDEVLDEDTVTEWPQSRERIRGFRPMQHIMRDYPGGNLQPATDQIAFAEGNEERFLLTPMFTVVRMESQGDTATSAIKTRYPDGSDWYIITIAKARGGKLAHLSQYFAPIYEAPEWRAEWVERMEEV